jgi:peptide/nickel transport system substrate-binding protein
MNQLHPPFNNPKVRQALLQAVNQERFVAAMGYPLDMRMAYCPTFFICGSPNETAAGAEPYRKADVAKAKQMLADAGYKGEKVVLLVPSDVPYLNAEALMAAQTMKSMGMNVDAQNLDWASIGARRAKRDAPEAGGWNMYVTVAGEFDDQLADQQRLPGRGLRQHAARLALRQAAGRPAHRMDERDRTRQAQASCSTPSRPAPTRRCRTSMLGQYSAAFAARANLKGLDKLWAGMPMFWALDR